MASSIAMRSGDRKSRSIRAAFREIDTFDVELQQLLCARAGFVRQAAYLTRDMRHERIFEGE